MSIKVKDLSLEELEAYIDAKVEEKLRELVGDPDAGLEFSDEIKRQLSIPSSEYIPLDQVIKNLGLEP